MTYNCKYFTTEWHTILCRGQFWLGSSLVSEAAPQAMYPASTALLASNCLPPTDNELPHFIIGLLTLLRERQFPFLYGVQQANDLLGTQQFYG